MTNNNKWIEEKVEEYRLKQFKIFETLPVNISTQIIDRSVNEYRREIQEAYNKGKTKGFVDGLIQAKDWLIINKHTEQSQKLNQDIINSLNNKEV